MRIKEIFSIRIPIGNLLILNIFLIAFFFQIFLITKFTILYTLLKSLFVVLVILLIFGLMRTSRREKLFILLCILFIIAIRLPFYLHTDGLIFSSDNALEALQSDEIRDTKTAPFYLLNSSGHNGTLKYLLVAFIWDLLGRDYLYVVLFQLIIFLAVSYFIYKIFEGIIDKKILLLFIFTNFAFIEVIFDYSLFLRAAPYLEMLFFFLFGVYLFDFEFKNKTRIFLSYYFFLFSVYLHPTVLFFVVPFALCTFIYALKAHKLLKNFIILLIGLFSGGFHLIYFQFFGPKIPYTADWYAKEFITPASFSLSKIPEYLLNVLRDFKVIFTNILSNEFSYSINVFFKEEKVIKSVFFVINFSLIWLSLLIFLLALIVALKKLIIIRKEGLSKNDWSSIFFLLFLVTILAKIFILSPKPFYEPRHNLDMAFLLMMSYLFVFSTFLKVKKILSFKVLLVSLLLLLFTLPHYYYFLKMTYLKEHSYREILSVLVENRVKYLATDFVIAYPIYFLTNRRIMVSDSLGPVTVRFFYPELKKIVDKILWDQKAYLIFSENFPRKEWHESETAMIKISLLHRLKRQGIKYKIFKFKYYIIIIPFTVRTYD